jgi:hypothetical protein
VRKIPLDHEVFSNVFDFSRTGLPGTTNAQYGAQGVWSGDRLAVILSATDVHCAWIDRLHKWSPHDYENAIRFGINMAMYSISH